MSLRRGRPFNVLNDNDFKILVQVDGDEFIVPPGASLVSNGSPDVYLGFSGDAPMLAFPLIDRLRLAPAPCGCPDLA